MKKISEVNTQLADNIEEFLEDPENLHSIIPWVVGLKGSKITIMFKRLLFKFTDDYSISTSKTPEGIVILFKGDKSQIKILYRRLPGKIQVFGSYEGPRRWIVWNKVKELAMSIIDFAVKNAPKKVEVETRTSSADKSELLKDLGAISKLLMKSMLLKSQEIIVTNGLHDIIEELHRTNVMKEYRVVYVSGSGNGTFRLLFIDGELSGVYAKFEGDDYVGDPLVLDRIEGLFRIKIYGAISPPAEVI